jgi:hypothetical protein
MTHHMDVDVDCVLTQHFLHHYEDEHLSALHAQFEANSVAILRGFCPPLLLSSLKHEADALMQAHGAAKNMRFELTDYTPRRLTTVGQPVIQAHGNIIPAVYESPQVMGLVSRIVGEQVHICPYAGERYVVSRLERPGDTHGWHWDDYSLGMIIVLEAPHPKDGGYLQCVPHTRWNKEEPAVYAAFLKSPIYSYALAAGDAYILRTDTTLHRVAPIREGCRRTIINMVWANEGDLSRPMTHETNDTLFGATT